MSQEPVQAGRRVAFHWLILLGLVLGAGTGLVANALCPRDASGAAHPSLEWFARNVAESIGQAFLRLIFMVVLPLVFSAPTLGVAGIGDVRRLGRMGLKTLLFTLFLSTLQVLAEPVGPAAGSPGTDAVAAEAEAAAAP